MSRMKSGDSALWDSTHPSWELPRFHPYHHHKQKQNTRQLCTVSCALHVEEEKLWLGKSRRGWRDWGSAPWVHSFPQAVWAPELATVILSELFLCSPPPLPTTSSKESCLPNVQSEDLIHLFSRFSPVPPYIRLNYPSRFNSFLNLCTPWGLFKTFAPPCLAPTS